MIQRSSVEYRKMMQHLDLFKLEYIEEGVRIFNTLHKTNHSPERTAFQYTSRNLTKGRNCED